MIKPVWEKAFLIIIMTLLTSCATTGGKIRVKASSDMEALRIFEQNAEAVPVWSSYPFIDFNGSEVSERMLYLIDRAEDFIAINSYLLMDDMYGGTILEALKEKHDRGVEVYVIADSSNRFLPGRSGFSFLEKNNIPYVEYNPIRLYNLIAGRNVLYRDHRKFWIVDGKYLYIGGCNIIDSSLKPASEGGNVDAMVLIQSAEASEIMLDAFIETWNRFSAGKLDKKNFKTPRQESHDTRVLLFNQNARHGDDVIAQMISGLFSSARKDVWIIQPYTFTNNDIIGAIRKLSGKGVNVHVILSGESGHMKFHYASRYGIKELIEAGADVRIFIYPDSPLHLKAFIIDDRWFSIGSANFNQRSFRYSDEANIVFYDTESVAVLKKSMERIIRYSRKVDMNEALLYRTYPYWRWHRLMQIAG